MVARIGQFIAFIVSLICVLQLPIVINRAMLIAERLEISLTSDPLIFWFAGSGSLFITGAIIMFAIIRQTFNQKEGE